MKQNSDFCRRTSESQQPSTEGNLSSEVTAREMSVASLRERETLARPVGRPLGTFTIIFALTGSVLLYPVGIENSTAPTTGLSIVWMAPETMTITPDTERFQSTAEKYAAYLDTPEGRLRLDLPLANLQEFLPQAEHPLHALDIGGGTGANAVRLATLGFHVTLLDFSQAMLDIAGRAAQAAGVVDKIALKIGDATKLASLFQGASFDLVSCHNVLEFIDDPRAVLRDAARMLRDSSSMLSVLVRNRHGELLKAALLNGDLLAAERHLTSDWGEESLYGGKVRLFTAEGLHAMLNAASLEVTAGRGVRVIADYLPQKIARNGEYERIFQLERKLGRRPEFAAVARYTHCLAHPAVAVAKDSA